jgi:hypothetical protein
MYPDFGRRIGEAKKLLTHEKETDGGTFLLHYGLRQVRGGRGSFLHGVPDCAFIDAYAQELDRLSHIVGTEPFASGAIPPPPRPSRVPVYVCDTLELTNFRSPFMSVEAGTPFLCLPSRFPEPTREHALTYARVAAVHEGAHVFTYLWRREALARARAADGGDGTPVKDPYRQFWSWFDEATALYLEVLAHPGNLRTLPFCLEWNDRPDVPLDDGRYTYRGLLFVSYLCDQFGPDFLFRVWNSARQGETAVQTIDRLLQEGHRCSLALPGEPDDDLFSRYCLDSYFLAEHTAGSLGCQIYQRFGTRMITESVLANKGGSSELRQDHLDHLACRFYEFRLDADRATLEVTVAPRDGAALPLLKGGLIAVAPDQSRIDLLGLGRLTWQPEEHVYTARLAVGGVGEVDHVALVVTNVSPGAVNQGGGVFAGMQQHDPDDGYAYRVGWTVS